MPESNKTSRNESSFSRHVSLLWPARQSRAAVEPNLILSQNTPIYFFKINSKGSS